MNLKQEIANVLNIYNGSLGSIKSYDYFEEQAEYIIRLIENLTGTVLIKEEKESKS